MPGSFPHRHLLGIEDLSVGDILFILAEAEQWVAFNRGPRKQDFRLAGLTQVNAFFENSTRTLLSFEIAGKRLGAQVVNLHAAQSSLSKGEGLDDTIRTIGAMRPDLLVVRHKEAGMARDIARHTDCAIVNAGDGENEHPTQALLDALTIQRRKGRIEGLTIAICGDVRHSRVARSNMRSLALLGARVRVVGPPALLPDPDELGSTVSFTNLEQGIADADVIMMLRVQRERISPELFDGEPDLFGAPGDYRTLYGLTRERLDRAAPRALVMHPGPMNRGVEIDGDVADDPERSAIFEQVEMGVAVRMAVLDILTRDKRG
ncbi:MAG TPA: aspartate carbamoyltransferase catalytic subunit [Allosphingosinicella sp.]|jgi:aspartate carbamoyltransferase catalytic subunit